jgi:hypothetical protein
MKEEAKSKGSTKEAEAEARGSPQRHPSRNLEPRARGYGIGGGYERPYCKRPSPVSRESGSYGPLPHSGYYGAGGASERFERGSAGYNQELHWYGPQYGEKTSGRPEEG